MIDVDAKPKHASTTELAHQRRRMGYVDRLIKGAPYGFLRDELRERVWFARSAVLNSDELELGAGASFQVITDDQGRQKAIRVLILD
jgi:hypothetical protein